MCCCTIFFVESAHAFLYKLLVTFLGDVSYPPLRLTEVEGSFTFVASPGVLQEQPSLMRQGMLCKQIAPMCNRPVFIQEFSINKTSASSSARQNQRHLPHAEYKGNSRFISYVPLLTGS